MVEEDNILKYKTKLNNYISMSKNNISEDNKRYCERMISKLKADIYVEEYKLSKLKNNIFTNN